MNIKVSKIDQHSKEHTTVILAKTAKQLADYGVSKEEMKYAEGRLKDGDEVVEMDHAGRVVFIVSVRDLKSAGGREKVRNHASKVLESIRSKKIEHVQVVNKAGGDAAMLMLEGLLLSAYQFLKYFEDADKRRVALKDIRVLCSNTSKSGLAEMTNLVKAVWATRDLVNEPVSYLTATQLSKEIQRLGKDGKFSVEVFNSAKINSLKMGGLLAVNKGSVQPPTFTIMEWKPKKPVNKKPIVLVGKGVVYDTGGLSLKPTANSMDMMKCDMGGAAVMTGTMYAVALNKLPVHVIALIPATDNRPGGDAYAPGDVIEMYNGKHVEVLNTDAEGRMILADALAYARKYDPELVMDAATLTGSAARAIGRYGCVVMGTAPKKEFKALEKSGETTYERVVEFPFWPEYGEEIKSEVADIKNLGGAEAGAITAGKFLEHFTDYPWIHMDIAGPTFIKKTEAYRTVGGTGFGVRVLYDFLKSRK